MDNSSLILALLSAGAALISGLISVLIGFSNGGEKVDRIFGIQALCFFTFLLLPPTGYIVNDKPPYPLELEIKRVFIWAHYMLMPFFFEAYTGVRIRYFAPVVVISSAISFFIMMASTAGMIIPLWKITVYFPLIIIGVYGLLLARKQLRSGAQKDALWLGMALIVYSFSIAFSLLQTFAQQKLTDFLGVGSFLSFHLNVLAFIFLMTLRIRAKSFRQVKLERELQHKNIRWQALVHHVAFVIVETDLRGNIQYMNPFALQLLVGPELSSPLGQNFIEKFVHQSEADKAKDAFAQVLLGEYHAPGDSVRLVAVDRQEKIVQYSCVATYDQKGERTGLMFFGLDNTDLEQSLKQVSELKDELEKENLLLMGNLGALKDPEIVGESAAIVYAIEKARQVAATPATVLLEGETGVGKEVFANLIHRESSLRSQPFIKVNCAALPAELIESELFGHEKGAFTGALYARKGRFEQANGGTIFLDEVGDLPLSLQAKLLRVLQFKEIERVGGQKTIKVDVRVISATNHDLQHAVDSGAFRKDLYYRLNVYPITIPALRKRKEDIPLLLTHYIGKFSKEFNRPMATISKADMNRLMAYDWPGNIRELINLVERSVITSSGTSLRIQWENRIPENDDPSTAKSIQAVEREHITRILDECNWRINGKGGAAESLGLNPNTLRSRMKKLNIQRQ